MNVECCSESVVWAINLKCGEVKLMYIILYDESVREKRECWQSSVQEKHQEGAESDEGAADDAESSTATGNHHCIWNLGLCFALHSCCMSGLFIHHTIWQIRHGVLWNLPPSVVYCVWPPFYIFLTTEEYGWMIGCDWGNKTDHDQLCKWRGATASYVTVSNHHGG